MSPPPGSSYFISNSLIRASRKALGLGRPIRIQFRKGWGYGNPLFHWYEERAKHRLSNMIEAIQLRKERNHPFFHEYIVIIFRDGSRYRIDRRQLPNKDVPLDSVYASGVEPYDTIEEVFPHHDQIYSASDCLIEVHFEELYLAFIIRICWAIHRDRLARVYTLQRYNCYFFAQTILVCATRGASRWYQSTCPGINPETRATSPYGWARKGSSCSLRSYRSVSSFGASEFKEFLDSFSSDSDSSHLVPSSSGAFIHRSAAARKVGSALQYGYTTVDASMIIENPYNIPFRLPADTTRLFMTVPATQHLYCAKNTLYMPGAQHFPDTDDSQSFTDSDPGPKYESSTLASLLRLIPEPLFEQLNTHEAIWPLLQRLGSSAPDAQLNFDWSDLFERFSQSDESPHQLYSAHLDIRGIYSRLPSIHRRLCRQLVKLENSLKNYWGQLITDLLQRIRADTHGFEFGVSFDLWHEDTDIRNQLVHVVDRLVGLEDNYGLEAWVDFVRESLSNTFNALKELGLVVGARSSRGSFRGSHPYSYDSALDVELYNSQGTLASQKWVVKMLVLFELEFDKLDTALRHQIVDAWGNSLVSNLEERTGSFRSRIRIKVTNIPLEQLSRHRRFRRILPQGTTTSTDSTHVRMQQLVSQLIKSHSVRVEQYKRWLKLKCTASKVEADIKQTMSDIWDRITSRAYCEACGGIHPVNFNPKYVY